MAEENPKVPTLPTLGSSNDWELWLDKVRDAAWLTGHLGNLDNQLAGNPVGAIPGGVRGTEKWRLLKTGIVRSLGPDPKAYWETQQNVNRQNSSAGEVVVELRDGGGYGELDYDSQCIEDTKLKEEKLFHPNTGTATEEIRPFAARILRKIRRLPQIYPAQPAGVPADLAFLGHLLKRLKTLLPPSFGLTISLLQSQRANNPAGVTFDIIGQSLNSRLNELLAEGKFKTQSESARVLISFDNTEDRAWLFGDAVPSAAPSSSSAPTAPSAQAQPAPDMIMMSKSAFKRRLKKERTTVLATVNAGAGKSAQGKGKGKSGQGWNQSGQGWNQSGQGWNPVTCHTCGGIGHTARVCPSQGFTLGQSSYGRAQGGKFAAGGRQAPYQNNQNNQNKDKGKGKGKRQW
jgi:hypothetical protein